MLKKAFLLLLCLYGQNALAMITGNNLGDCAAKLSPGGWCEILGSEPSKFILTKNKVNPYVWGSSGSSAVINAWTGMATDGRYYYLTGGGHADYGGNEVYRYDPAENKGIQLTKQSKLTHWFIRGKNQKGINGYNKYCRTVNTRIEPSSTHTYDGIEYSKATNELIVTVYGASNHSCIDINIFEEAERYAKIIKPTLLSKAETGGVYALNLSTLTWRKLFTEPMHTNIIIRTEFRGDGVYFFGNRTSLNYGTFGADTMISKKGRTTALPNAGDGVLVWDQSRKKFWSDHGSILWELDRHGNYLKRHNEPGPKRDWRALVIDNSNNQLVKWDGANALQIFTPETGEFCNEIAPNGRQAYSWSDSTASWTARQGQLRVYTKFKYIQEYDVFIGVSEFGKPFLIHKRSHSCKGGVVKKGFMAEPKMTLAKRVILSQRSRRQNNKKENSVSDVKRIHTSSKQPTSHIKNRPHLIDADVKKLQKKGLLPTYGIATHSVNPDLNIDWTGNSGERSEIGLFPEQHAAFIAGQADLKDSILEAALAPPPLKFNHTHHPNEFWLPYLLTGNPQYIANMEAGYKSYKDWRNQPYDSALKPMLGREAAWNLRDLVQLAYLQEKGLTTQTYYIDALNASRDRWLNIVNNPTSDQAMFNILKFNSAGANTHGFTGWMQAMFGQALNYTALITKDPKWVQVAAWQFKHLLKSSGDKWPLKATGYDHVFMYYFMPQGNKATWREAYDFAQTATWDTVSPYPPSVVNNHKYIAQPDNHLLDLNFRVGTYPLTYANRAQYAYGWAALACKNGIDGACDKAQQLFDEITLRGDRWDYKNGVMLYEIFNK